MLLVLQVMVHAFLVLESRDENVREAFVKPFKARVCPPTFAKTEQERKHPCTRYKRTYNLSRHQCVVNQVHCIIIGAHATFSGMRCWASMKRKQNDRS